MGAARLAPVRAAGALGGLGATPPAAEAGTPVSSLVSDPASLVDPFAGTGTGAVNPGSIGEFPGADVPFGMMQWSPDTAPDRISGSGYSWDDHRISGFSLTHMSGTGCASYGDVPILPTTGAVGSHPNDTTEPFSHASERAAPGRYSVALGSPAVTAQLTVTTRTGLSRFTYPTHAPANVLFKVSDSAAGASASAVRVVGNDEVSGQVTSGQFCQTGTDYTAYFVAVFDRPFAASGTWAKSTVSPGSAACSGPACGAYVTFPTGGPVEMKVGLSFVSAADAGANLAAEDPGWSLARVATAATARWNALLGRDRVGGGTRTEQRIFYTALYHSLLHPNVVSDVNGQYAGEDGQVHQGTRPQYANFSEWDIYRSEIELVALVAPGPAGDMVQSLVNDAQQVGWLPKWAIVGGDASQMNGDSADPIIASAYAFGVRDFDTGAALAAMVKGADEAESPQGLEIERQYLDQYLSQHYVDADSLDLDSIDYSDGASVTLEYAIDDFSIAQLAGALGDQAVYTEMMARAHNWEYLFNPATGSIQARGANGSFPPGPVLNPALFEAGGQRGFEEGNPVQYTWSVPQDLFALGSLMGGNASAVTRLNALFTRLNAGRHAPYDWAGNEPSLWTPWEYDAFGAPWRTQQVVRRIMTTLYADRPVNEPGNDDLGAISSWYVWAAMGLYPLTPGTANLALSAPLFPEVVVTLGGGRHLVLDAPGAGSGTPYVHSLSVSGIPPPATGASCTAGAGASSATDSWDRPWLPASALSTGGTLTYRLAPTPDRSWASAPADAPPSYAAGRVPAVGYSVPSGAVSVHPGVPATLRIGVKAVRGGAPPVEWQATATGPVTLGTTQGTLDPPGTGPGGGCASPAPVSEPVTVPATGPGPATVTVALRTATGETLPPVVVAVDVS